MTFIDSYQLCISFSVVNINKDICPYKVSTWTVKARTSCNTRLRLDDPETRVPHLVVY